MFFDISLMFIEKFLVIRYQHLKLLLITMLTHPLTTLFIPSVTGIRRSIAISLRKCHSVFGIKKLVIQDKPSFTISQVKKEHHEMALEMIKQHYLNEHVLVRSRHMDIRDDRALDEYLIGLIKQGNTIFAKAEDGSIAGFCVCFASSPVDPKNLRTYAFYRQDPNTKDFLYFTAKLQETPNLWTTFKQQKIFEVKMLAVLPEYRRQGLAVSLVENSKDRAHDQGYNVIRMDCINPYDFKVAERCMLQCIVKFPLHKLRGANAPFIKRSSEHNRYVRVYVGARALPDVPDLRTVKRRQEDFEKLID